MKSKGFALCVFAFAVGLVAALTGTLWSQQPEPPAAGPEKPGGLLGAIRGEYDPLEEPRRPPPAGAAAAQNDQPAEAPRSAAVPVAQVPPDPQWLEARIRQLESMGYDDVKPVSDLDLARQRINVLRQRAREMQLRADRRTLEAVAEVADRAAGMQKKWQKLTDAMKDGKTRSAGEWDALGREVRDISALPPPAEAAKAPDPAAVADRQTGLPGDEELKAGDERPEDHSPATAAEDELLKPLEGPRPESDVQPPDFSDLCKAVRDQQKPSGMHPLTWARLMDAFEKDIAETSAAVAATRRSLRDRRDEEFAPVAEALEAAQRTYANLKRLEGDLPEYMRRQMAWRLHQARLAQMRLALADQQEIAREREGRRSDRKPLVETYPLAPEKTLAQMTRLMHVSGMSEAPPPDAFDNLTAEGLPDLYPPGSKTVVDERVHYGHLVRANIDRYQRLLRDVNQRLAHTERDIADDDRAARREKWSELLSRDRLAGDSRHPLVRARRRDALRDMYRDQLASRAERVQQREAELKARADKIVKRLGAEYKRRDEAEGKPEVEPAPEPEVDDGSR